MHAHKSYRAAKKSLDWMSLNPWLAALMCKHLQCLWNEILGCCFIVSDERPFDTEVNAIYSSSRSLLVPDLLRFKQTKSVGHWKASGNKNFWRNMIRKRVLWKFKWSISHLIQIRFDGNFANGWSNIKVIWSWQNFCCQGNNVVPRHLLQLL